MIQKRFVYEHIMTEVALEIVYVENNGLFNRWCYDNTLSNGEGDSYLTLYTKSNSKVIKDLNIRSKTLKLLEENITEYFYPFSVEKKS